MPNSDPQIQVLKFVTYIYKVSKLIGKMQANYCRSSQSNIRQSYDTLVITCQITGGSTPLLLYGTLAEWTSSGVDSTHTQRPTDLMPTLKFNACTGQWPKQSAKRLSFSVSVQSGCDRKSPGG